MAIKKSLEVESESNECLELDTVQEMKVLYPTKEEFKEPMVYIEKLYKEGVWKYGCVKIIPPADFQPPFSFNEESKDKLPFREQTLHNLKQNKVSSGFNIII